VKVAAILCSEIIGIAMYSPKPRPLVTSRRYTRSLKEDAHSVIRVQNLSTQALVGSVIWGIGNDDGRHNFVQPLLISCTLSLREPFRSAAQSDSVNNSTVNYSTLSKEILKVVASRRPDLPHSRDFQGLYMDWTLYDLIEWIQIWLTGCSPSGNCPPIRLVTGFLDGVCPCLADKSSPTYRPPLLDDGNLLELGFRVFLPKGTLLSGGVSLSISSACFLEPAYRSVLKIHDIRIPTLVGVNKKERLAKQFVIVSVEVDPYVCKVQDYYNELEQIIVKVREHRGKLSIANNHQEYRRILFRDS
jgi:dihydroneopterin aldolase